MFIQIEDPSDLPRAPNEVKIRDMQLKPYPDGRRLRVLLELTPFEQPPDLSLQVLDQAGEQVADLDIIAAHQNMLGLTVHLRGPAPKGQFSIQASVRYEELGEVHQVERKINLPMGPKDDTG
jgi:hypothetical protein